MGDLWVNEEVARHDKCAIRRQMMASLRALIEAAGGVWMRLSAYPHPYRIAFNFRLDHDDYDAADFDAVCQAIGEHEEACSHFVCASTHEAYPECLTRLRGMDVGSHGYWHHTYRDPEENRRNIGRGIESLRAAGIETSGFVAPHGRYNRGLGEVLEQLGVSHSSEFGLAYDEWPFFPECNAVLQVPIHPVCLGIAMEAAIECIAAPTGRANKLRGGRRR